MANESVIYDLANSSSDIDKVLQELIGQLNTENKDKVFYIREFTENEHSYLEISTKEINASDVNYTNATVTANNVQEVIDYILNKKKISVEQQEIPIGDGEDWVYGRGASSVFIKNSGTPGDSDNNGRSWKMIGTKKSSNNSIVLTDAMDVTKTHPQSGYSYLELGDNSQVAALHNVDVKIGRQNTNFTETDKNLLPTRIHIFDGAKVDIDGGEKKGSDKSPQVFLHGPIKIHMDDGIIKQKITAFCRLNYTDIGGRPSPDLTAQEIITNSATTKTFTGGYSSEQELLDDGFTLASIGTVYKNANYYSVNVIYEKINTYTGPSGLPRGLEGGAAIAMHDKSFLTMSQGAMVQATNNTKAYFDAGRFEMKSSDTSIAKRDPYFLMEEGAHIIMGGHDKDSNYCGSCLCLNGNSHIVFNAGENDETDSEFTRLDPYLLADPNGLMYVGQGSKGARTSPPSPGSITNPTDEYNFGNLFDPSKMNPANQNPRFKISDESLIIIDAQDNGSNYIKVGACTNGQTQTHILDNTHLELRQNSIFSLRGTKSEPIKDYPITRMTEISNDDTGSMLTMYDKSTFIMRSEWDEVTAEQYADRKDFRKRPLTQETWQPNLDFWKQEGSPLFGMVGDSVLKMQGGSTIDLNGASIVADGTGFTFKVGSESVSFTIGELQQLKALLSSGS